VLLVALVLALAAMPALAAISRRWERRADWYAVELTNDRVGYQRALRWPAAANLSDLDPPAPIYPLLFTHPRPAERLTAANGRDARPLG
jgi:Zn-dependent protease with chaperone function